MSRYLARILLAVSALLACLVLFDIYQVRHEVGRNRAALDRLTSEHIVTERHMREIEDRINRIKNDRRLVETMALAKYRMLRSDQYILHDPTD